MTIIDITNIVNPMWQEDALCTQYDPSLFIGTDTGTKEQSRKFKPTEALKICARCPVKQTCLDYALEAQKEFRLYGVWGGVTERVRQEEMKLCKLPGCKVNIKSSDSYCGEPHHEKHIKMLQYKRKQETYVKKTDYYLRGKVNKYA